MEYLHWKEETLTDKPVVKMYNNGFVFTRIRKNVMQQTRSIRINLDKFELSSENRRILRKGEEIKMEEYATPYTKYSWEIGKLAKDFYDVKAGGAFTANKIKEILTTHHNFNTFLNFSDLGYAICYRDSEILHYSYPFYDLKKAPKDMGLIMMTKVLALAQEKVLKYVYLGSLQRPTDVYKLQFSGVEWFDGKEWSKDIEKVKIILNDKYK
jgi:arginyl-tRNA--protein-N-Asp/Glu arginylyltransferase